MHGISTYTPAESLEKVHGLPSSEQIDFVVDGPMCVVGIIGFAKNSFSGSDADDSSITFASMTVFGSFPLKTVGDGHKATP